MVDARGQQTGPHEEVHVEKMFASGALTINDNCWSPSMAGWDVISNVPALVAIASKASMSNNTSAATSPSNSSSLADQLANRSLRKTSVSSAAPAPNPLTAAKTGAVVDLAASSARRRSTVGGAEPKVSNVVKAQQQAEQAAAQAAAAQASAAAAQAAAAARAAEAAEWKELKSAEGTTYFWHQPTGRVQWDTPTCLLSDSDLGAYYPPLLQSYHWSLFRSRW